MIEDSRSFLGFDIPPLGCRLGGLFDGSERTHMFLDPWMVIWPGLALSIVVYGINMFGNAVKDVLDPRLRGSVGHYVVRAKMKPQ